MSSLQERVDVLERDLLVNPLRISAYHDLPFAILRYDPASEFETRRQMRLFATRLQNVGKRVHVISIARMLWAVMNAKSPTHAIIFDVSMDRGVRTASERLTEIMYKALLRDLGYAEDFDLAELEMSLEADGLLDKFCEEF